MKKIYTLILLIAVVASCKDDDNGPSVSVEERLTAPRDGWVFESATGINPVTGQQEDFTKNTSVFKECDLDNAVIFNSDGTYIVAANTKCSDSDSDVQDTGTWTLNSDKTSLNIVSSTGKPQITLTKLSVDDTNIKGEASNFAGFSVTVQVVMKKK